MPWFSGTIAVNPKMINFCVSQTEEQKTRRQANPKGEWLAKMEESNCRQPGGHVVIILVVLLVDAAVTITAIGLVIVRVDHSSCPCAR